MFIRVVSKTGSEKRCFYLYGGRNNWKRDFKPVIRNLDLIQSRIGETIDVIKARAVMSTAAG